MLKKCEHCGEEFNGKSRTKYCSKACSNASRGTKQECSYCGEKFKPTNKNQTYCSHMCHVRDTRVEKPGYVECPVCRKYHDTKHRWYICCSMKCYNEWQMFRGGRLRQHCDYYFRKKDAEQISTPGTMAVDRG